MQFDLELSLEEDVNCFHVSQVKNYSCGSQVTYVERSCTRMFWSNQTINDEDVNLDEPYNLCDMLFTEEQGALVKSNVDRKFFQTRDSKGNVEANVQDIMSTLRKKVEEKRFHVDVYSAPMDNVSFHPEIILQKWKYVL